MRVCPKCGSEKLEQDARGDFFCGDCGTVSSDDALAIVDDPEEGEEVTR